MKKLYLLFGLPNSGRREILMDLAADLPCSIALPEAEPAHPMDCKLATLTSLCRWRWENNSFFIESELATEDECIFLVADGKLDPADQIEATKIFLDQHDILLGRIFTVVHCSLVETHPELVIWHQGCIHFSDVVLLNRRENVSQKWLRRFQDDFRQKHFPCFFEFIKKGRVNNPVHVLDPTARRLSLFFEEEEEPLFFEEDEDEESEELLTDSPEEDPYLAKLPTGQRCKPLPDAHSILSDLAQSRSA